MNTALSVRQEFGAQQTTTALVETASTAIAAQSKAMVEARYIMAMQRPRNWDQVRQDLVAECKRPSFAHNKSAYYRKPIGQGVEGLGIRFVEVALRCMKNVLVETTMIFEDDAKEVHRVSVTDLESNLTYPLDVRVSKTVERSKPSDDGSYIAVRKNSYGKSVYTVPANDDDLLNKRAALISKAIRTLVYASSRATCRTKLKRSSRRFAWMKRHAILARNASALQTRSARSAPIPRTWWRSI